MLVGTQATISRRKAVVITVSVMGSLVKMQIRQHSLLPDFLIGIVECESKASQIEGHVGRLLIDLPDEQVFRSRRNFLVWI